MSLGSVPYNPYNTSFAGFAAQGLQMAQQNQAAIEANNRYAAESAQKSFLMAADMLQKREDNKLRKREADRMDRSDAFREYAFGEEQAFKQGRAVAQDSQFGQNIALHARTADQQDRRLNQAEDAYNADLKQRAVDNQFKAFDTMTRLPGIQAQTDLSRENARHQKLVNDYGVEYPETLAGRGTSASASLAASEALWTDRSKVLDDELKSTRTLLNNLQEELSNTPWLKEETGPTSMNVPFNPGAAPGAAPASGGSAPSTPKAEGGGLGGALPEAQSKNLNYERILHMQGELVAREKELTWLRLRAADPVGRQDKEFTTAWDRFNNRLKEEGHVSDADQGKRSRRARPGDVEFDPE